MIPVGIAAALPFEARGFTGQRHAPGAWVEPGEEVLLKLCGVGPAHASQAGRALLARGVGALVSFGSAGGLDPALRAGDLLLPSTIIAADGMRYESEPSWRERVFEQCTRSLSVHCASQVESSEPVLRVAEKKALFEATGALAVDMESAALARVAREANLPFLAVRAVLDPAAMAIVAFAPRCIDSFGRLRLAYTLGSLLSHAGDLRGLLALQWAAQKARRTLRAVVQCIGPRLMAPV